MVRLQFAERSTISPRFLGMVFPRKSRLQTRLLRNFPVQMQGDKAITAVLANYLPCATTKFENRCPAWNVAGKKGYRLGSRHLNRATGRLETAISA